jgi:hypothetical protein
MILYLLIDYYFFYFEKVPVSLDLKVSPLPLHSLCASLKGTTICATVLKYICNAIIEPCYFYIGYFNSLVVFYCFVKGRELVFLPISFYKSNSLLES